MKVLFLSKEGDGLGVAHKLAMEGHDVEVWVKEERFHRAGVGIVGRPKVWRPRVPWADLVVCDMVGFGSHAELFAKLGKPTFCCDKLLDILELERGKCMELFKLAGIDIPETWHFPDIAEAKKLLDDIEWKDGVVLKPEGNLSTAKTMVLKERDSYEWCLKQIPSGTPLIVQRVVQGIEVSTEGWFNGRDWLRPFNHTFEEKRFLTGDLGPNTGCMGNVVITSRGRGNKLTSRTVERLTPLLKKIGYRGVVDVNCIVDEDKAYALEITSRLGYDAIEALMEGMEDGKVGDLLFETATGVAKDLPIDNDPCIALRLSIPPWPSAKPSSDQWGEPILGLDEGVLRHFALTDVYLEDGQYYTAGGDGVLGKVTAHGADLRQARERAYRTIEKISVSAKQYRVDIGKRAGPQIEQLRSQGWL